MLSQMIHEESIRTNHVLFFNIQHAAEQVIARWIVNRYKTPFNAWREAVGLAAVEEEIIDWKVKLAPMKRKYTIEELKAMGHVFTMEDPMKLRARHSLFTDDRETPEAKLRKKAAAMDHGKHWVVIDILRSRQQVMGGMDDFQVRALPTDTVRELKKRIYDKQVRFNSPDLVYEADQAVLLYRSKNPLMDRLVGCELNDNRTLSEYGIDGADGTFNARSNNVEDVAAAVVLVDVHKIPKEQKKRFAQCRRDGTPCFQQVS